MDPDLPRVAPGTDQERAAREVVDRHECSRAVVDADGRFLGLIPPYRMLRVLLDEHEGVFGRRDWVANGILFGVYHLHVPWAIPSSLVNGVFFYAYPARRFESTWMGSSCTRLRASSSSASS